jgi:hypothetical protein
MLGEILNNREAIGKIAKWAIEFSMYGIIYNPQIAIKAHVLSDSWLSGLRLKHHRKKES